MTAKERAEELVYEFIGLVEAYTSEGQLNNAKQCALIVVEELIESVRYLDDDSKDFWFEVKLEIQMI